MNKSNYTQLNPLVNQICPFIPEMEEMVKSNEFQKFTSKERFTYLTSYTEMRFIVAFDKRGIKLQKNNSKSF